MYKHQRVRANLLEARVSWSLQRGRDDFLVRAAHQLLERLRALQNFTQRLQDKTLLSSILV